MKRINAADKQNGAILLTTLLIMTIMAILTVAIFDDIRLAVKRSVRIDQAAQSLWYQKGAQEYADLFMAQLMQTQNELALNAYIQKFKPIVFPLEGGSILINVTDASNCFPLGALTLDNGAANANAQEIMIRLLQNIGDRARETTRQNTELGQGHNPVAITSILAQEIAAQSIDWVDMNAIAEQNGAEDLQYLNANPAYRTANTGFGSVMELRSLAGVDEAIYQTIRPYFCAGNGGKTDKALRANINSASPDDLAYISALLSANPSEGDSKEQQADIDNALQTILTQRPVNGFNGPKNLWSQSALQALNLGENIQNLLGTSVSMLRVEADINFGQSQRSVISYYQLNYDTQNAILIMRSANPEQNWSNMQQGG